MKCLECLGACCEEILVEARPGDTFPAATREWYLARGAEEVSPGVYALDCRCPKLTLGGRCSIYDERPLACAVGTPGAPECLGAVRRRRTPQQYGIIRDEWDPEMIHDA